MGRITTRRPVTRIRGDGHTVRRPDTLAVEEPLEIRVGGRSLVVTMRTPGHDVELAAGFLVSEGVLTGADDLLTARYCAGADADGANSYNVLDLALAPHVAPPAPELARSFTTTSACGVCGKDSIDAIGTRSSFGVADDPLTVTATMLLRLPDRLRDHQNVFDKTGGLHAAALFDGATGEPVVVREDVGRHNAVDKVVGWALTQGLLPLRGHILQVSGRASFELVQKAVMAGIPMLSAVSAPSSLAADLADESGLTLLGFVRGDSLVAYTREDRIDGAAPV
ncbi:formate dehydrogenase accessory sulfurtransferase FdhD [Gordonia pseudamarae]|jgi:FdhD protein|uniref:Sulfur carrier protein FdhD n=1 Tax=Gordonia pseudamarae TaxID=2831662 RepID=A0ABX6IKV0_9ACTN|nr:MULTISPECIES: formate dehydrogenase accessory sulfurtransferase FdhD [Gordonia]MBD0024443.1 formate dehydrogenase accessory sulfurtransferase FdhD [Gordonia sp. (in: high G+C Gram-positive bacteria)]QHN27402.1 formate dehydrogenase accessory sulfurtransferase FdhD [Gordonia pseudamarae]QHN36286.1 formate dehydrogenase accessory sulfurtransferase FdhD [Gordonia pseudamarae]